MDRIKQANKAKACAAVKRNAAICRIQAIHALVAQNSKSDNNPILVQETLIAMDDLDDAWARFVDANDILLDATMELECESVFSNNLELQLRSDSIKIKAVAKLLAKSEND